MAQSTGKRVLKRVALALGVASVFMAGRVTNGIGTGVAVYPSTAGTVPTKNATVPVKSSKGKRNKAKASSSTEDIAGNRERMLSNNGQPKGGDTPARRNHYRLDSACNLPYFNIDEGAREVMADALTNGTDHFTSGSQRRRKTDVNIGRLNMCALQERGNGKCKIYSKTRRKRDNARRVVGNATMVVFENCMNSHIDGKPIVGGSKITIESMVNDDDRRDELNSAMSDALIKPEVKKGKTR